jgi:hypothetical protein
MNWPIGCGKDFQGVYDREKAPDSVLLRRGPGQKGQGDGVDLDDRPLGELLGEKRWKTLQEDMELLGAGREFDMKAVHNGTLAGVLRLGADQFRRGAVFGGISAHDHRRRCPGFPTRARWMCSPRISPPSCLKFRRT